MKKEKEVKIGLEIHVQLKTKTKLFCNCSTEFGLKPNSQICPVCLGLPGVLPVFNEKALELGIKTALGLNAQISPSMRFDRKHYFYPDMPKNFQISQYEVPLAQNGFLDIDINSQQDSPKLKRIRIRRIHLEEDVGKLIHKRETSHIDYNRAGIPLLEIVTEPDISSPDEAYLFLVELKTILQYLDVSNCDMEKGELRVDTNVSLKGFKKVEIKNLNSFKAVKEALYYEIERQKKLKKSYQETRLWDSNKKITISMRKKEEAFDYRYFPEPDLPIFKIRDSMIKKVKLSFPELPFEKRKRFQKEYDLDERTIRILVQEKELADYFEKIVSEFKNWIEDKDFPEERMLSIIKTFSNYLISDLKGLMAEAKIGFDKLKITPENFSELIFLIDKGEISSRSAKDVLKTMFETGADPSSIIEEKGLKKISDFEEIERVVKETISENQKAVEDYKKGKETALEFLLGKVMMKTKGKLDPQKTREAIKKLLS